MRQTAGETPSAGFVRSCRVTAALYCCSSGARVSGMSEPDIESVPDANIVAQGRGTRACQC